MLDVPPSRKLSLRGILLTTTVLSSLLALVGCASLIVLTTMLHRTTESAASSVESVRLAEEAEIALLLHARIADPASRLAAERELRQSLRGAGVHVTTQREAVVFAAIEGHVEEYIQLTERGIPSNEAAERAYLALEDLVSINVEESRTEHRRAKRWNQIGMALGIGTGLLLFAVTAWMLWWLRGRVFPHLFTLAEAMQRFGRGERDLRAPQQGPAELQEMSARFNEMAAALAAQRQAQMTFLAGVAHDLRTPLSTLKMTMGLVQPHQPLPPEPQLRSTIAMVDRQIVRLERMVGDFMDTARIEAGQLELTRQPTDVGRLMREAIELFTGARDTGHPFTVQLPAEPVEVSCDAGRIEQVVTNLISNAIKYSPAGCPITVALATNEDQAVIEVRDQGVGIDPEDQQRIFEPFARVGSSTSMAPGLGLGLSIIQRIVEAHRGRIEVSSVPDQGSTFRVILPLHRELVHMPAVTAPEAAAR